MESIGENLEYLGRLTADTQGKIYERLKRLGKATVEIGGRKFTGQLNQAGQIVVEFEPNVFLLAETAGEKLRKQNSDHIRDAFNESFLKLVAALRRSDDSSSRGTSVESGKPIEIQRLTERVIEMMTQHLFPKPAVTVTSTTLNIDLSGGSLCKFPKGQESQKEFIIPFENYIRAVSDEAKNEPKISWYIQPKDGILLFSAVCKAKWRTIYDFFVACSKKLKGPRIPQDFGINDDDCRDFRIDISFNDNNGRLSTAGFSIALYNI